MAMQDHTRTSMNTGQLAILQLYINEQLQATQAPFSQIKTANGDDANHDL